MSGHAGGGGGRHAGHASWFALLRQLGVLVSVRRYRPTVEPAGLGVRAEAWRQMIETATLLSVSDRQMVETASVVSPGQMVEDASRVSPGGDWG